MYLNGNQLDELDLLVKNFNIASWLLAKKLTDENVANKIRVATKSIVGITKPSAILEHKGLKAFYINILTPVLLEMQPIEKVLNNKRYSDSFSQLKKFFVNNLTVGEMIERTVSIPLTFDDLDFSSIDPLYNTPRATINFDNGYGLDVIRSTDQNEFHVNVTKNGQPYFQTPIANDTLWYQTRNEINKLIKQVKEL